MSKSSSKKARAVAQKAENKSDSSELRESLDSLADSMAHVVARLRAQDKRQSLNSFVAYVLFTVLLGAGFALLYHSRVGALSKARDDALRERDAHRDQVTELQNEIGRRDAAAEAAYQYYALIRDKRRTEVIARYPEVEELDLTPAEREFFAAGVARARSEMVDAGYLAGLDAFRRGDYRRAITELERALGYEVEGQQAALIRYYLGVSQHKVGDSDDAIRNLELALAGRIDQAGIGDARYHLAGAFEAIGSLDEARVEYGKFVGARPRSPLAPSARGKVGVLARKIAQKARAERAANASNTGGAGPGLKRTFGQRKTGGGAKTKTPPEPAAGRATKKTVGPATDQDADSKSDPNSPDGSEAGSTGQGDELIPSPF